MANIINLTRNNVDNSSVINDRVGVERYCDKDDKQQLSYNPFQMRDKSSTTTAIGALLHLMKSSLGTGILAMPNAFKNGGLIFGLFGTLAIGVLCAHCIYLLILCSQTLARRIRRPALGFADTAYVAINSGPRRFRAWSSVAKSFVNAALFCTYYFGNCVYVLLISTSFKQVADNHTSPEWHFSIRTWILGLALPLLPLGVIRTLKVLVPLSAIATAFILVGLGCTITWVVTGISPFVDNKTLAASVALPDIGSRPWIAPITQIPLFFATGVFAMEGIGTVLPIENSMRKPKYFLHGRPCGVLNFAMMITVPFYAAIGFLGYLRFGNTTEGSITLNLPNDLFSEIVKMLVTLSIIFSYGLQFCVPSEIVWDSLEPWLRKYKQNAKYSTSTNSKVETDVVSNNDTINTVISTASTMSYETIERPEVELEQKETPMNGAYYIMRAIMVIITFFIAAIVPNLAPVISLFGAVFFSILGLLCPAVIHLFTFWEQCDYWDGDDYEKSNDKKLNKQKYVTATFDDIDLKHCDNLQENNSKLAGETKGMSWLTVIKDCIIILFALFTLFAGAHASLVDIVAFYGSVDIIQAINSTAIPTI